MATTDSEWDVWVCSVVGHGYHDSENPCPEGVEPIPENERPLCVHEWNYDDEHDLYYCTLACGATHPA